MCLFQKCHSSTEHHYTSKSYFQSEKKLKTMLHSGRLVRLTLSSTISQSNKCKRATKTLAYCTMVFITTEYCLLFHTKDPLCYEAFNCVLNRHQNVLSQCVCNSLLLPDLSEQGSNQIWMVQAYNNKRTCLLHQTTEISTLKCEIHYRCAVSQCVLSLLATFLEFQPDFISLFICILTR